MSWDRVLHNYIVMLLLCFYELHVFLPEFKTCKNSFLACHVAV